MAKSGFRFNSGDDAVARSEKFMYAGRIDDAVACMEQALPHLAGQRRGSGFVQLARAINLRFFNGAFDRTARRVIEDALGHADEHNDAALGGRALQQRGEMKYYAHFRAGWDNLDDCLADFEKAFELAEAPRDRAAAAFFAGLMHQNDGRADDAVARFEEAISIAAANGLALEHSYAVRHLGFAYLASGAPERAFACFQESLDLRDAIGFEVFKPFSLIALGYAYMALDLAPRAGEFFHAALERAETLASPTQILYSRLARGGWRENAGDRAGARADYEFARANAAEVDYPERVAAAEKRLAALGA